MGTMPATSAPCTGHRIPGNGNHDPGWPDAIAGIAIRDVKRAKAMGMEREIGSLAAGKLADLVILDADPLADVMNLSKIHRVIKDGKAFAP